MKEYNQQLRLVFIKAKLEMFRYEHKRLSEQHERIMLDMDALIAEANTLMDESQAIGEVIDQHQLEAIRQHENSL